MKDSVSSYIEHLFNEFSYPYQENSPCQGIETVSIIVNRKRWKKRKKYQVFEPALQPPVAFRLSRLSKPNKQGTVTHSSMPELREQDRRRQVPLRNKSGHENDTNQTKIKQSAFQSKFITNVFSEHRFDNCFLNPFNYPSQTKWRIYRCQLGAVEDSCCCSCNSDAMFEVMKGLYDCYKAKNCDGCDCVLCGYKSAEEKKLAELRKSMTSAARNKILEGKTPGEKEFILKEMAKTRQPLPSGKTSSEKALIDNIRKELGLPPSPKTLSEKSKMRKAEAAGIVTPLEGKTPEQKEEILRAQAEMGLPLPEGRTDSEKSLIDKVKKTAKKRALKKSILTPLSGKTPEEKERILRGRALKGLPLPEAASASEKKLIDKVRTDLGLPKDPTTKSMKEKHEKAAKAGLLQPLEGKTPEEKEKTLKGLRSLGIPLPEGRTPSEKALIAKVKASPPLVALSEQLRRAKAEGLLTPLAGKTPEQKENIIKGLAMKGLPLPEAASPSEKKLIAKVRADLGLPKEPDTKSMKDKHEQAAKAGLLQPLEGKTPQEKEKTLKGLQSLGIPLPEGRTPSEKALIAKVKASPRSLVAASEQLRRAKAEGLLTPLAGKTPEQKENIIKGLAMKGLPLPEAASPSEKKLIAKVRADLGLPKEPDTKSMKDKHEQAARAGLLQPLEGKTPQEKEKTLKGLQSLGIPLPEGRTPSEKALIAKVKASPRSLVAASEQLRGAKAEGLLTPLAGKTPEQKEKILKGLALKGLPLPEAKSPSEKKLIAKVRADLGLPKEPDTKSMKDKHEQAARAGLLQPLEGKTPQEKEKTLKGLQSLGIPLPEGRTPSEKALIAKVKASPRSLVAASEQLRGAKAEGLLTPLAGKTPEQKEKILKGLALKGLPLPEAKSPSEKKLIAKVRADLGLPKEPDTKSMKDKHEQAARAGLLQPLEGKTPQEKEKTLKGLQSLGIPLPEGRTPSEKALIAKVKASPRSLVAASEQLRGAKAEGLLTPLAGKTPEQKEKILKGLALKGLSLPEAKSPSEKKLIAKVRADLGLPKEPDTKSMKDKFEQAAKAGLLLPLEGQTPEEKEKTLKGLHELGIPLPEGRTPSEKALVAKVKSTPGGGSIKTEGVMTPLAGKTPELKEKVLKARAKKGIPLPEGTTPSEKKIIDKVRADLGLPKEPDTKSMKAKHEQAAKVGLLEPLEGKTPAQKEAQLKGLRDMGIPLPEGRTPSEKALIAKVKEAPRSMVSPSEQMRRAKAEGLMTPLAGKTPAQKEKILKGLAMKGIPLPEGKSPSEKKLIDKVRDDLGLPKEPDTKSMKDKYEQAAKAGLLQPLVGKTSEEKEKILQGQHDLGIPLPEGRTPSEKALIAKVKASPPAGSIKTAGIMTPLAGKAPALKEKVLRARAKKGIPLPEGTTPSEKKIIDKVRADLGLPKEPDTKSMKAKHEQAAKVGLLEPLEGKTPAQKEAQLKGLRDMGIPLPEGRTPSEKALIAKVKEAPRSMVSPSEQMRRAKAEGLMSPLAGKTPAQKEKILKGLAMKGIPLPEGKSPSEKKLIDKVRDDLGLPKEPDTKSMKDKYEQAAKAGLLQPLVGKTSEEKEKILQGQHDLGIPLPEGRTPSEKALIAKVKGLSLPEGSTKTAGIMTPLAGKAPALKEKVLRARAKKGIPLPEGTTPSEKKMIDKVRADLGLPKEPDTQSMKAKHEKAAKFGLLEPLEGKTRAQKEAQLKGLRDMGIPLPEGRTLSEKSLIAKVKYAPRSIVSPSEHLRRAKAEGLMTPLAGKTPAQKERILKGLALKGIPLPESKTPSEKKIIDKIRTDLGLPKEPDTQSMKAKHEKAAKFGLLEPLEGKTRAQKEAQLKGLRDMGIPLPEGRTVSEKSLIAKVKYAPRSMVSPSEQLRRAKAEGLMTPLAGKTAAQKERILKGLALKGIPLPESKTPSDKKIIDKVRAELGLPKEPDTKSMKVKHEQAAKAGLLEPLEGKTPAQKEALLKGLRDLGIPLPEGRTPSEKALVGKITWAPRSMVSPSEQLRRAKAEGLVTPLAGKTPAQKEKILKGLAMKGIPLPEAKSPSEKKLIDKVRNDLGLPKEPDTKSMKDKYEQAAKAGLLKPLVGKTPEEKEKILQGQHDLGIPLPEGRTPSEKALIAKVKASPPAGSIKTAGIMTPLAGKAPALREKVLRARAKKGIPLPEGTTPSEKKMIDKVRADLGLPKEPDTKSMKAKHEQAAKAGLLEPLEGKTPAQKEAQLKGLRDMGIPLPEGRTPSEKALIAKVKGAPRSMVSPSEQLRSAKAEGLITPLTGKTPAQKEKILKGLAMKGIPLPEGKSPSEKKLIDKVRDDLGLPKEPDTKSMKSKYDKAAKAGFLQPLVGKTSEEKEKILQGQYDLGIPLPEGRTPSEKALIAKVKASPPAGSIKTAGLMTPLAGKPPAQQEKVLRARAMKGIPLPEGATPSEKKVIDKVRADLGLPKEPDTKSMKAKHEQAAKAGLLEPLEGKTSAQKEAQLKGLRDMGIPLPEGRTPSEKALIDKVKGAPKSLVAPSEQIRRAKAEGLMTPLTGKTPAQKEKILKGLAMKGIPLPEGKSPSEKKLIDKVRDDLGLPKEPDTKSMKSKYDKAAKAGFLQPLVGKTSEEKEKILQGQYDLGIPLPEGRTPSEKALIAKVKASPPAGSIKTAGLMTPLAGKPPAQQEKVLRARAMKGIPLPEGATPSEKKVIDKVRADLGLPKEPDTKSMKAKHEQAAKAGLLEPLEGKTSAQKEAQLKGLRDMGIPLPEGRTPSEKALIDKVKGAPKSLVAPSEQIRRAKAEGLMTPLTGKTPAQKEKILKGLAMKGIPLPEGKSPSEKKLIDKVRDDLGLPKEPDTKSMKSKYDKAAKAGFLQPLVGKTSEEKEKILQGQYDLGIPLPEGRTPSEKALIAKVKASPPAGSIKTAGLMTPLAGKPPAQQEKVLRARAMKGIPLPEGATPSEKKVIDKVRADLGLPKEPDTKSMKAKHEQAAKAGLLEPLEGKTSAQKEAQLKGLRDMGIPLPEGRTPSEKALIDKVKGAPKSLVAPSEQIRRAKAEGLMTPLTGKTPVQKEKILKGLAMKGIPLPEGKSPSEKKLIDKVRDDLGLPKEPDTKSMKAKHEQAAKAGLLEPLEGKTPAQKEAQLKGLRDMGIPLPEGRTPSEKALIDKVKGAPKSLVAPSEQIRRAKAEGLMTPLTGKTPAQKEKILKGLAMKGIPLPEGKSPSEKKLIDKVRDDLGLPKEPDTKSMKSKYDKAAKAGFLQPLVGKTSEEKEKILQGQYDLGIPLPEGRTPSEKALIAKVKASPPAGSIKTAGLMTPLAGKPPAQQEKVLRARAMKGIPLPEGATPSEKKVIDKVRADLGLPKEPDTKSMKAKHEQAAKAGLLEPLEGKTSAQKEAQLKGLRDMGIPLPEGRTPSEKALIDKVKGAPKSLVAPSEQIRRAKAEGLMTPLTGKTPAQKEKILKGLAMKGIPLPEGKSPSEKKIIDKVRADLGLPKEPDTKSMKAKHEQAAKVGLLEPLEGKTPTQKEAQLKGLRDMGIPLPEGRTPSEKALIAKVKAAPRSMVSPSEQLRRAKVEGLMTPLTGKTLAQKEKILKGLAMKGIPLPEGKSPSDKKLIDKVRDDLGLPKEPDTKSMKDKYEQAAKAGLLQPLVGKTPEEKERILQGQHDLGIPLPEGRTPSEKALIAKVKASPGAVVSLSEQLRRVKEEGLLTPLKGKTPEEKENIIKRLAMKGLPLPVPRTPSEKKLVNKIRADLGLPKEPTTKALRDKHEKAAKAGLLLPLEGMTPKEKEKTLKGLQEMGIPLPDGRTPSEKALVAKVKASKRAESMPSITTEKLKQAKAAGLLTPLAGKTPEEKEKILRGLAQTGLPLPEGTTPSDKELIDKVKEEFGIPDRTPSEKLRKAKEAGLFTPLEGKTPAQKEKILRGRIAAGLPLPKDHSPADRALLKKIKDETGYVTPSASEKLRRAKAAGLLTPLEGKSPEEQEKILKGLAEAGLPLPAGKTKSEKSMIAKIKARTPSEGKTPSEKSIIGKAKAAGLFTPITGKAPAEKERILKGLADAGLPLPEGKTASEKDLVKKIRAQAGLPPEPTPSEKKGKIRKKEKKVGVSASKKAAGIAAESFQDIIKTTKCDRGCGCDRKKIRFKHSYVKIRVTSPDISSFCDCPDECFPGVKNGAFIDNDGIKVTIGSAVGIPSYSMMCINQEIPDKMVSNTDISKRQTNYYNNVNMLKNSKYKFSSFESGLNNNRNKVDAYPNVSCSDISYSTKLYNTHSENNDAHSRILHYQGRTCKPKQIEESFKDRQSFEDIYKKPISETKSASSSETILIIRNDMSLSTSTSNSTGSFSLTSNMDSSITSSSAHYSGYQSSNDLLSINSLDGLTSSDEFIDHPTIRRRNALRNFGTAIPQQYTILRMSQLEDKFGNNKMSKSNNNFETKDPIMLFNRLPSELDVSKIMLKVMAKKRFAGASSIFVVVPKSEDEEEQGSVNSVDSTTSMRSIERLFTANTISVVASDPALRAPLRAGLRSQVCGKGKKFYLREISSIDTETMIKDEFYEINRPNEIVEILEKAAQAVGSDITADRPHNKRHNAANVTSRHIIPFLLNGKSVSWFRFKESTESSEYNMNIAECFERTSSPVPHRLYECSPKHKTAKSPLCSDCSPADLKGKRNEEMFSIESKRHEDGTVPNNTGKSWFRQPDVRNAFAACDIPRSCECDCRFCPESPNCSHHRARGHQKLSKKEPKNNLKLTWSPIAKAGKLISWFRFPSSCKIPTACDTLTCDPSVIRHHKSPVQWNQSEWKPFPEIIESETIPKRSGVLKWLSWTRISSKRKKSAPSIPPCSVPQYPEPTSSPMLLDQPHHARNHQNQISTSPPPCVSPLAEMKVTRNRSAKVQKPSIQSIYQESEATWQRVNLSGPCLASKHTSVPSIRISGVPTYIDFGCSPVSPQQTHLISRNEQSQKPAAPSLCACPPDDRKVKTNQSGISLSWFRRPRLSLSSKRKTSSPSIQTCNAPEYVDSTCSPFHLQPDQPRHQCTCEQSQTSATSSLCARLPDDRRVKSNRSGVSLTWSRIPRKTSTPSIKTCDVHEYVDSSCSPVLVVHPRDYGCNEQSQTSAITCCACPPDDWKGNRNPSAKVQKPSIESIYHEGETTSKIAGVAFSWSRLPSKCKTYVPARTSNGVSRYPRLLGRNELTQTPKPLYGYPTHDMEVLRNPSAKVQKRYIRRETGTAPKKSGIASGWLRLPGIRKAPSKFPNKSKYMESFKGSKSKSNTTNLFVLSSEPGGQPLSGQILQLQQMSAIKQEYYREIYCPFRKPNETLQPEFATEIFKIPDFIDQQTVKSIKAIAPARPKLASIKTIEQKGQPKTHRQNNENKPKLNTVTLSDLKPETYNLLMSKQITQLQNMSHIEEKEFRTILRRPWPEQDPMPQLAKGIYIEPSCKRLDTGKVKKLRSEKTQSDLKAGKRKNLEKSQGLKHNIELDFADAIRYFASMNPERFQQLMQEELDSPNQTEDDNVKGEKKFEKQIEKEKKKADKEAKKGQKDKTTATEVPISDESESDYPQGFKISFAGKNDLVCVDRSKIKRSR